MRNRKKLPIGIDSFEKIIRHNFYYVDKTEMITELLHNWGEVNLFTRPRRFGKSLNMNMLQSFLEIGCDKSLFNGLKVSREKELCEEYMGKFPVISLTLKNVEGLNFESARRKTVNKTVYIGKMTQQPYKAPKVKCLSFWYKSATPKLNQLKVSYKGYEYNPNTGELYITARMQNTSSYTITKVTMYFEIPLDETATPTKTYNVNIPAGKTKNYRFKIGRMADAPDGKVLVKCKKFWYKK